MPINVLETVKLLHHSQAYVGSVGIGVHRTSIEITMVLHTME